MLSLLFFVLGMGFLGKRSVQYRRVAEAQLAARAKSLAEAGLEDALVKIDRDLTFPPISEDQEVFSYHEEVLVDGRREGGYTVTINGLYRKEPYSLLLVRAQGQLGEDPLRPEAQRTLYAEIDVSRTEREDYNGDGSLQQPNPFYRHVIQFLDLGAL